jgi:hypothetical protein
MLHEDYSYYYAGQLGFVCNILDSYLHSSKVDGQDYGAYVNSPSFSLGSDRHGHI